MKLYGSLTSPYVRKIRLLFAETKTPYDFQVMNIWDKDRNLLKKISPVAKIPAIEENGKTLFDSRVIFNEIVSRGSHPKLDWKQENLLSVIDGIMDSLINRYLLKRSNIELDPASTLGASHRERLELSFPFLENAAKEKAFEKWDYISMSLYCLLDWVLFRELYSLKDFPELLKFHAAHKNLSPVVESDPRQAS